MHNRIDLTENKLAAGQWKITIYLALVGKYKCGFVTHAEAAAYALDVQVVYGPLYKGCKIESR